jgi:hypothetical protein
LAALPQSASAQAGAEGETSESNLQEPEPSSEPAPEEPALEVPDIDTLSQRAIEHYEIQSEEKEKYERRRRRARRIGVEVVPSPPRTVDGYTLEEIELRMKRARIGLGVSALSTVVGIALSSVAWGNSICFLGDCSVESWVAPVGYTGAALVAGGVAGMTASGILLRRRKRDRDSLRAAHYGTPRRAQWDLAQSRLVF